MKYENKMFSITSICKADILDAFKEYDNFDIVKKRVEELDDADMKHLASKMADDYLEQLYWDSLRIIFEYQFLNNGGDEK